jgi:monoterpene epsilon-lactone hydrolase
MKTKLNVFIVFLLLCFSLSCEAQSNKLANDSIKIKDTTVWVIKNRSIPAPAAASQILKHSITSNPQPNYNSSQYVPKNNVEWKGTQKYINDGETLHAIEVAKKLNITVEKKMLNGIPVHYLQPVDVPDAFKHAIFFHIHGGAYVCFAGEAGITEGIYDASFLKIPTISVDYRMPPDSPYPAALDDVIAAYKGLLALYPNYKIVIGGVSSGGGLAMSAILKMKELKMKLPDAVFLASPWSDLTKTGDSYYINEGIDRVLVTTDGFLDAAVKLYVNGHDLRDQYLSPIYGDLSGFPPTFLVTGTRDLFLSNTVRAHRKLRDAGVVADLVVIEGMSHGDYFLLPDAPESRSIYKDLSNFLNIHFKDHH